MPDELVRLHRFNRLLTQRIGLLDERYLDAPLPFTQARVLYEVAVLAPLGTHHLRRLLTVDAAALNRRLAALGQDASSDAGWILRASTPTAACRATKPG